MLPEATTAILGTISLYSHASSVTNAPPSAAANPVAATEMAAGPTTLPRAGPPRLTTSPSRAPMSRKAKEAMPQAGRLPLEATDLALQTVRN